MKKYVLAFALIDLASKAFPLDMSAGFGASLDFSSLDMKGTYTGVPVDIKESTIPVSFKAFFDLSYFEFSLGFMKITNGGLTITAGGSSSTTDLYGSLTYLDLSAYLKYPISLGSLVFFPLVGVEYRSNLTDTDGSGNDITTGMTPQERSDLSELWLQAGIGADVPLGNFYIRTEVLIGFKPLSATDNDAAALMQGMGYVSPSISYFTAEIDLLFGWYFGGERATNVR